ncbi:MAG: PTS sugar transporter subunit IIA [Gammaproteobacteria bacterium]
MNNTASVDIAKLLPPEHILLAIDWQSKKRVFEQISIVFENIIDFPRDRFFTVLLERERLGSTYIGEGVAIPHGCMEELQSPLCALALLKNPIQYGANDHGDGVVRALFFLLAPQNADKIHLSILGMFAEMAVNSELMEKLFASTSPQEAHTLIAAWAANQGGAHE